MRNYCQHDGAKKSQWNKDRDGFFAPKFLLVTLYAWDAENISRADAVPRAQNLSSGSIDIDSPMCTSRKANDPALGLDSC